MLKKIWMASDNTHGQHYEVDTDLTDIIDIAYKYGRAEQGELVQCDGETAGWNSQRKEYLRQQTDGTWGGKREGSGRPSTGRRKRTLYITDEEYEQLTEHLETLRK